MHVPTAPLRCRCGAAGTPTHFWSRSGSGRASFLSGNDTRQGPTARDMVVTSKYMLRCARRAHTHTSAGGGGTHRPVNQGLTPPRVYGTAARTPPGGVGMTA
jgi:hypothetical protein